MLRSYYNGLSLSMPTAHKRAAVHRTKSGGWTEGATRRNTQFLQSVDTSLVTGHGIAITLTLRDCPPTPKEWTRLIDVFIKRLRRLGLIRYHWVTEWQRRGVPHLHMCAYFTTPIILNSRRKLIKAWCQISSAFKAGYSSQHIVAINGLQGWLQYSAKHGARGIHHYQRSNPPAEWQISTGKVWSKGGDWPTIKMDTDLSGNEFHRFRRIVRAWRKSNARSEPMMNLVDANGEVLSPFSFGMDFTHQLTYKRRKRILSARKMLKCNDIGASHVRGVSEWIPLNVQMRILNLIKLQSK